MCDVHNPNPCTNPATHTVTKPCGHQSLICADHIIAGNTMIIACPEHQVYWDGPDAYTNITPIEPFAAQGVHTPLG